MTNLQMTTEFINDNGYINEDGFINDNGFYQDNGFINENINAFSPAHLSKGRRKPFFG